MTQRQGETLVYINGQLANTVNAPEFNFNKYTTMPIRRIGDAGDVVQQSFHKLQNGHEFPLIFDYQTITTGVQSELFNAIADDDGVTVKVCTGGLLTLPSASAIAGPGVGGVNGVSVLGDFLYFNYSGKIWKTHKYLGTPVGDVYLTFASANADPSGIHIVSDTECYVVDATNRRVYRYARIQADGTAINVSSFALHSANDNYNGIWASDDYIYVSDAGDRIAYAYARVTRAYTPSKNITLTPLTSGAFPRGITGFGGIMYAMFNNGQIGAYDITTNTPIPSKNITAGTIVDTYSGNIGGRIGTTDGKVFIMAAGSSTNRSLNLFDIRTGEQATLATTFNAIVLNAPIITTDPNDPSGVEQVTYNLKINGQIL